MALMPLLWGSVPRRQNPGRVPGMVRGRAGLQKAAKRTLKGGRRVFARRAQHRINAGCGEGEVRGSPQGGLLFARWGLHDVCPDGDDGPALLLGHGPRCRDGRDGGAW